MPYDRLAAAQANPIRADNVNVDMVGVPAQGIQEAPQRRARHGLAASPLRLAFDHALPAALWLVIAIRGWMALQVALASGAEWPTLAHLSLNSIFLLLVAGLFVCRRPVQGRAARPVQALVAIAGTLALNLIGLLPPTTGGPLLLFLGGAMVVAGMAWSVVALAALGRCFGVFPEARGLVTRGPYRLVSHPLYLGEIVAGLGMVLPVLSPATLGIWVVFVALQCWRAVNEEQALVAVFPEYAAYRARTKHLVPFIW